MIKKNDTAVRVDNLSKSFKLPHNRQNSIKSSLVNVLKGGDRSYETQNVLKDVSFEVNKGDFFGIVGRNGSGKSTLLKLIAGIYHPDKGKISINGSLVPFIELGVGFNPELTGRENVFLNGALLGFSHDEMDEMYGDIVEFAELERFMDQKLKNYSSGMQVRLAFSIAIKAQGDILILDEVLAVGDEAFQRKCYEYFAQLKREQRTVVLVTHDMNSVQRFCNRALLIEGGKIEVVGGVNDVTDRYKLLNMIPEEDNTAAKTSQALRRNQHSQQHGDIKAKLYVGDILKKVINGPLENKLLFINTIKPTVDIEDAFFGFTIRKDDGTLVYWYTTERSDDVVSYFKKDHETVISLELQNIFGDGVYVVDVSIKSNDRSKEYIIKNQALQFTVTGWGNNGWTYHPEVTVRAQIKP